MNNVLLFTVMIFLLGGCSNFIQVKENTVAHMISLNRGGDTFDLKVKPCRLEAGGTDGCQSAIDDSKLYENCRDTDNPELKCLIGNTKGQRLDSNISVIINHLNAAIIKAKEEKKTVEVFLFIHGGMVSKATSASETENILDAVQTENNLSKGKYIYPLFINWESGMGTSYLDHLFHIRQGEEAPVMGPISSPFYFTADLGRALTRLPITFGYQSYRLFEPYHAPNAAAIAYYNKLFYPADQPRNGNGIYLGENKMSVKDKILDKSTYPVPGFVKILSTPTLDFIGKSAWDNMLRRTKTVFNSPNDYKVNKEDLERCEANLISHPDSNCDAFNRFLGGGAAKLMRRLGENKAEHVKEMEGVELTIIGHSMGSIVATELLKRFGNEKTNIIFDNIVYMAAAATTRDFQESVVPYLKRHHKTDFYNLTLHPYAEENEKLYDLVPRGSLLVWIDDFASDPATIADMTFGKWENAIRALPFVPTDIRNRITLKGFGVEDPVVNVGNKPQQHGEFNDVDVHFWHHEFWKVPGRN